MASEGMKPRNTNLISLKYINDENKYYATFKISNIDAKQRKRIIERKNSSFADNCKITAAGAKIYVIKYFNDVEFEVYASIVEHAKKGLTPERVDPAALEQELDICMLEQDIDMSIDLLSKPSEELKELYGLELRDDL